MGKVEEDGRWWENVLWTLAVRGVRSGFFLEGEAARYAARKADGHELTGSTEGWMEGMIVWLREEEERKTEEKADDGV